MEKYRPWANRAPVDRLANSARSITLNTANMSDSDVYELRVTALSQDISATAYWYQTLPHQPLPELPDRNGLEVI